MNKLSARYIPVEHRALHEAKRAFMSAAWDAIEVRRQHGHTSDEYTQAALRTQRCKAEWERLKKGK